MNGNFAPYIYNNRSAHTNNGTRPARESETPVSTPFYHPNSTGSKTYEAWHHRQQQSNNRSFNKNTYQQDHNYGRVMTEGNPLQQKPPQTHPINNINQQFQMPTYYPNQHQNIPSRNNGGQVYKSSIYENKSNSYSGQNGSIPIAQKTNLNQSGGNNKGSFNPPKRMPRASQPSFPSQLYMLQNPSKSNLQTQPSSNNISMSKQQHNFSKVKGMNVDISRTQQGTDLSQSSKIQQKKHKQGSSPYLRKNTIENHDESSQHKIRGPKIEHQHLQRMKKKITINDFKVIRNLGSGKYGRVYLALQKCSGFICALKVIEKKLLKQEDIVQQYIREIKIQMYLHHPHIIKMYGYFDDQKNIYTILQLSMGGQLFHQLKKSHQMAQNKVAMYMRQVCDAVREIHSQQIIHRDIKPQNIVLHENIVKLCDFGWSVHQDKSLRTTFCGTPLYVCPEILKGKDYNQQIDIWSLGVMMYEMLVGQNPFKITREQELIKIIKDEVVIPSYVTISKEAKDFLDRCLKKNPGDRATIRELVQHEFFKKYPDKTTQKKMSFN